MKYDYYFSNRLVSQISVDQTEIQNVFAFQDYYIAIFYSQVIISPVGKTPKIFRAPEDATFNRFCVPLSNDKFLFLTHNPSGMFVADFETGETKFEEMMSLWLVFGLITLKDKVVVLTHEKMLVVNSQTLKIENIIQNPLITNHFFTFKDHIITIDIDDENHRVINFWNLDGFKSSKIIPVCQGSLTIEQLNNKLIIGCETGRILIVDLERPK